MVQLQNSVKLVDGIICYTQAGDQNREVSMNTISLIMLLAGGMSEVKLLVDYTDSGVMDDESIQKGYYALEILPLDKAAIVGATPHLKKLITSMARAAGKSKLIHFAKNRETAIDWLKK